MSPADDVVIEADGHRLKLSNLQKVLYPKAGFTKAHVIDYYRRIAPVLLPHLRDRALTMKRYPDGVDGEFFYEKRRPAHAPDWVRTEAVWSGSNAGDIDYIVVDRLATLIWLANLADLELHTFLAYAKTPLEPTMLAFDLDPGDNTDIVDCARVALRLREVFDHFEMKAFPKTSGSKGMQVYVPLNMGRGTFEDTKAFARAVGEVLERETPDLVTTNMSKAVRPGRIFVDWSQNDDHKTTVCVYSLRARDQPTVSTPLRWDEVEKAARTEAPGTLRFDSDAVLTRVADHGDLFAPVLTLRQALPVLA